MERMLIIMKWMFVFLLVGTKYAQLILHLWKRYYNLNILVYLFDYSTILRLAFVILAQCFLAVQSKSIFLTFCKCCCCFVYPTFTRVRSGFARAVILNTISLWKLIESVAKGGRQLSQFGKKIEPWKRDKNPINSGFNKNSLLKKIRSLISVS